MKLSSYIESMQLEAKEIEKQLPAMARKMQGVQRVVEMQHKILAVIGRLAVVVELHQVYLVDKERASGNDKTGQ